MLNTMFVVCLDPVSGLLKKSLQWLSESFGRKVCSSSLNIGPLNVKENSCFSPKSKVSKVRAVIFYIILSDKEAAWKVFCHKN